MRYIGVGRGSKYRSNVPGCCASDHEGSVGWGAAKKEKEKERGERTGQSTTRTLLERAAYLTMVGNCCTLLPSPESACHTRARGRQPPRSATLRTIWDCQAKKDDRMVSTGAEGWSSSGRKPAVAVREMKNGESKRERTREREDDSTRARVARERLGVRPPPQGVVQRAHHHKEEEERQHEGNSAAACTCA